MTEKKPATRRTRTTKPKADPELVEMHEGETVEAHTEPVFETAKPVAKQEPAIEPLKEETEVEIVSNIDGAYGYVGPNSYTLYMEEIKQKAFIPMKELRMMYNSQGKHIREGWIVIKDERAIKALNLGPIYEGILDLDEIDLLLQDAEDIKATYPKMPRHIKRLTLSRAKANYKAGRISDLEVIQAIQTVTGVNIMSV